MICGCLGATSQKSRNLIMASSLLDSNSACSSSSKYKGKPFTSLRSSGITRVCRWPSERMPHSFPRLTFTKLPFPYDPARDTTSLPSELSRSITSPSASIAARKCCGLESVILRTVFSSHCGPATSKTSSILANSRFISDIYSSKSSCSPSRPTRTSRSLKSSLCSSSKCSSASPVLVSRNSSLWRSSN
jgi:hypothetical protein